MGARNKKRVITRKAYDYCADEVAQNFLFIFGNQPGKSILAETQMVYEISQVLSQEYDIETLSIQIPRAFDFLKSDDAHFEIVTSPTLQPIRLMYNHNKVTKTVAYVFVNTKCRDVKYKNAKQRGMQAY